MGNYKAVAIEPLRTDLSENVGPINRQDPTTSGNRCRARLRCSLDPVVTEKWSLRSCKFGFDSRR
jgi:hypothetical protein